MRILILTPQLPYPPHQGTTIRNYNLIAQLGRRHEIDLLSFVRAETEIGQAEPLRRLCRRVDGIVAPQRSRLRRLASVLLSPQPDMALRLPSPAFRARLACYLQETRYDIVQVEGIEMAQYALQVKRSTLNVERLTSNRQPLLVFDDHNAEYVLQQRAFETDARQPRRWIGALYSLIQWQKLRRYERHICQSADRVVACSEADAAALQRILPGLDVTIIPNGVDTEFYQPDPAAEHSQPATLLFTGKMDFRPNIDAVCWFCEAILPRVWQSRPDTTFLIAGRDPHPRVQALAADSRIVVTGYVADTRPYFASATIYVVPLRIGGGTRLKVLEAMAMAKPIISTTLGCEGIDLVPGQDALLADSSPAFADLILSLLDDPARRASLAHHARRLAQTRYDWANIVPRLERVYQLPTANGQ